MQWWVSVESRKEIDQGLEKEGVCVGIEHLEFFNLKKKQHFCFVLNLLLIYHCK
jgi:hypothetical protein